MIKHNILVDMDGVIADFELGFLNNWRKKYPELSYIPLDERKTFYIVHDYPEELKDKVREIYLAEGFIANLPVIEGSLEALKEMKSMGMNVKICTSPLSDYKNCVEEKYEWVDKHLGKDWIKDLILIKDKTLVMGMKLIDDRPEIRGAFEGITEHIIFDRPYNREVKNKRRLNNWFEWKELFNI